MHGKTKLNKIGLNELFHLAARGFVLEFNADAQTVEYHD